MYLSLVLFSLALASYLALGAGLVVKYIRTRDQGFIWLGLAVIVLPLVTGPLDRVLIHHLVSGRSTIENQTFLGEPLSIGNLVSSLYSIQNLIRAGLLLISIFYLCKEDSGKNKALASKLSIPVI